MKRDPDLLRQLATTLEGHKSWAAHFDDISPQGMNANTVVGHLKLMEDAGLVDPVRAGPVASVMGYRLTWQGHEFLEKTRDPEIWEKTKAGAAKVGTFSIPFIIEVAGGYLKAKAAELGIPMM